MGIYSEYLDRKLNAKQLEAERKKYLKKISQLRKGNDILSYVANINIGHQKASIIYEDILAIRDQLANLSGKTLDVILETPGGLGEVAEDIVKMFRNKYSRVNFIIPGTAKSAGTIMAMSGDEILMDAASSLGPIDAQLRWGNKTVSADALLTGFEKIKNEVLKSGNLSRAYVPMLTSLSPGDMEQAKNARDFALSLVTDWLCTYKFKNWKTHSSSKKPVTPEERKDRANKIAEELSNQEKWKTHGRSIKIHDLESMKLIINDYSQNSQLNDAITRYYTVLRILLDTSNIYKVIETPVSQIYRFMTPIGGPASQPQVVADEINVVVKCNQCKHDTTIQARLDPAIPIKKDTIPFPQDNQLKCSNCESIINLYDLRLKLESELKRRIL